MITKIKSLFQSKRIYKIIFAINIVFIIFLIAASLAWIIPPSKYLFFQFLGITYPIWLALNLLMFLFWLIFKKWFYCLVVLVFLILDAPIIYTYFPLNRQTAISDIPPTAFKILTYNVGSFDWTMGKDARNNPIFDYVKEQDASIVCFQEVLFYRKKNAKNLISERELKKIFKNYKYIFFQKNAEFKGGFVRGVMILSKFPILETEVLDIHSSFNGALLAKLNIDGNIVTLINVHLESNKITEQDKADYKAFLRLDKSAPSPLKITKNIEARMNEGYGMREDQVNILKEAEKKQNTDYTIICGDFNDTPISYVYHSMRKGLVDAFTESGKGPGISFNDKMFPFHLDHIMHSPNIRSYNTYVDRHAKYSDHYPVISILNLE